MSGPTPIHLSGFSAAPPSARVRLLFIHHSCGGQLLAPPGPDDGENCVYRTHPNGGGLRPMLEAARYEVHEASYGSAVGERTDLFDWLPKLRTRMAEVLRCAGQDESYPPGRRNQVVVFKSCFPNSAFVGAGDAPGNPVGPLLTVENARATMLAVREELAKHPEVLFLYVTAPPLAPVLPAQALWKVLVRTALGRQRNAERLRASGALARTFNDWMSAPGGWLRDYPHRNVAIFDYHRVLADPATNLLRYPTGDGSDSHPSAEGNLRAAERLVPILNRAVRRAGLLVD